MSVQELSLAPETMYYDDADDADYVDDEQQAFIAMDEHGQSVGPMGITTKIPPAFDGRTSWFAYEELIDDWIDLTTLDPEKHGPALKNRLSGDAAVYKPLLNRDLLRDGATGVQYFKD